MWCNLTGRFWFSLKDKSSFLLANERAVLLRTDFPTFPNSFSLFLNLTAWSQCTNERLLTYVSQTTGPPKLPLRWWDFTEKRPRSRARREMREAAKKIALHQMTVDLDWFVLSRPAYPDQQRQLRRSRPDQSMIARRRETSNQDRRYLLFQNIGPGL
jgi:hypothetical protein